MFSLDLPEPTMCVVTDDDGCTVNATECSCKFFCGEDSEAGCCFCCHSDIYAPCPRGGLWCDPQCGDVDDPCCEPHEAAFAQAASIAAAATWKERSPKVSAS